MYISIIYNHISVPYVTGFNRSVASAHSKDIILSVFFGYIVRWNLLRIGIYTGIKTSKAFMELLSKFMLQIIRRYVSGLVSLCSQQKCCI